MKHGPLGVHITIGKGYDAAIEECKELGITCCQLFTHNPRGWQFAPLKPELGKFKEDLNTLGISPVASHCNYLINLGTTGEIRKKSLECLKKEFEYADAFGCTHFVLHVGKHKDDSLEQGIENVAQGINSIKSTILKYKVMLLLETVAGQGSEIGANFGDLTRIFEKLDPELDERVGVCLDTCHIFAAGYDIRTEADINKTIQAMTFGVERIKLIHLNDSLKELGERRDRHVHIGEGFIGKQGFSAFLNHPKFRAIPKVLETPDDGTVGDKENLARIRKLQK